METFGKLLVFASDCFDRLLIHGYLRLGFHRLTEQAYCWLFTRTVKIFMRRERSTSVDHLGAVCIGCHRRKGRPMVRAGTQEQVFSALVVTFGMIVFSELAESSPERAFAKQRSALRGTPLWPTEPNVLQMHSGSAIWAATSAVVHHTALGRFGTKRRT